MIKRLVKVLTLVLTALALCSVSKAYAKEPVALFKGAAKTLTFVKDNGKTVSNKKVTWTSSDKSIVSVSKKGIVKGKTKGTATITGTYGKTVRTYEVTVEPSKTYVICGMNIIVPEDLEVVLSEDDYGIIFKRNGRYQFMITVEDISKEEIIPAEQMKKNWDDYTYETQDMNSIEYSSKVVKLGNRTCSVTDMFTYRWSDGEEIDFGFSRVVGGKLIYAVINNNLGNDEYDSEFNDDVAYDLAYLIISNMAIKEK